MYRDYPGEYLSRGAGDVKRSYSYRVATVRQASVSGPLIGSFHFTVGRSWSITYTAEDFIILFR